MNNILEPSSPIDVLALNYASFGVFTVVNNLWTWVAIITAAVSFWRIRTTSFSDNPDHQKPRIDRNTSRFHAQPSPNSCAEPQAPALPSVCDIKDVDGVTEGSKYTVYYYEKEEEEETETDGEATVVKEWRDDDNGVNCGEWWERVTNTMRARTGDMEWYRYQDLTVVNGNVVRLWDECRRI